jgi:hypothetical protein
VEDEEPSDVEEEGMGIKVATITPFASVVAEDSCSIAAVELGSET